MTIKERPRMNKNASEYLLVLGWLVEAGRAVTVAQLNRLHPERGAGAVGQRLGVLRIGGLVRTYRAGKLNYWEVTGVGLRVLSRPAEELDALLIVARAGLGRPSGQYTSLRADAVGPRSAVALWFTQPLVAAGRVA